MIRHVVIHDGGWSRRATLGGAAVLAVAAGLRQAQQAFAQEGRHPGNHPLLGTWAVQTAGGIVPQTHAADGSLIAAFPPTAVDPMTGLTFQGAGLGRWEATSERGGRFTFVQALSGAGGAFGGTFQLAAEIEASEDGQRWVGEAPPHAIVRDAANIVVFDETLMLPAPVTATRIGTTLASVTLPAGNPLSSAT